MREATVARLPLSRSVTLAYETRGLLETREAVSWCGWQCVYRGAGGKGRAPERRSGILQETLEEPREVADACERRGVPDLRGLHAPQVVIIAEMEASYLTTEEGVPFRGYCCLVLKRHAVELHDLGDAEAASLMDDMRRVSRALQAVTGAVKINVDIHGNTLPHLHAHFFPRYVGDPYEDGPIDFRRADDTEEFTYGPEELRRFVEDLRSALGSATG